ncbi:MAG TPA: cobyric acid synthase [Methylomirabilota bacterium]|nr:cobyric acid synthase [Methylomirabilota bacterium]
MTTGRRARALMIQGTGSHAGKTVLVAGLCRLLARRGLDVLPFKSQNMALNAFVTADGGEMGWAQAMQAEAAGATPRVEMNPVLLKPRRDRSQVVLLGKVLSEVGARDYYRMASTLWPAIETSYRTLARSADVVVIEGAGSPAEPNLMRRDLANMRVARMARASVVIVGDIDRGGVFASLVGTMALLPRGDRARVGGFLINKFRGDAALLAPALRDLARRTRKPTLGVVPFLPRLNLPEEDSVALDSRRPATPHAALTIGIVRLPHIANFTDFAPLESEPGVELRYAETARDLVDVDLAVLPGSKDTIADLRFVRLQGFEAVLRAHLARGGAVLGICGGYQMLGHSVEDPGAVESGGAERGLGLLPVRTVLESQKTTRRVVAAWLPDGPGFDAYEIHVGRTEREAPANPFFTVEGAPEGCVSVDGRIRGTYLHGLLDSAAARRCLLDWARATRAEPGDAPARDARNLREAAYDRLADTLEAVVELAVIDELIAM